tara:strand:+ start:190 stop:366 length:177 start_codon:yes stop_codon:yes gene_type:complete
MPVEEIGEIGARALKMKGLTIERRDSLSSKLDRAEGAELKGPTRGRFEGERQPSKKRT